MTFEAQTAAVEKAVQLVGGVRHDAGTSGEYYAGVRAAFNEALRRGRLSWEAEASLREAVRAIDEIFQSSHPQFYAGRAGDWVRLAVFGIAIGMLHFFVSAQWVAIPAGVTTLIAYRLVTAALRREAGNGGSRGIAVVRARYGGFAPLGGACRARRHCGRMVIRPQRRLEVVI